MSFAVAASVVVPLEGVAGAEAARVNSFTLVNAQTGKPLPGYDPIQPGATIDLAKLPTRQLNIRVNVSRAVQSVRVAVNDGPNRLERSAPFAVMGGRGEQFAAWTPPAGEHRVTVIPVADGQNGAPKTLNFSVVDAPARPALSAPDDPEPPAGEPVVNLGANNCGPIPAAPAGWQRRVTSTFSETTRLGSWPGPVAARDWTSRPTGYRDSSGRGTYSTPRTVSEHDGVLDVWIHSEGDRRYVAAPIPKIGDTSGQRIAVCMRADRIPGYKLAFLLWPDEGPGNFHGEINFPEGKLTPTGEPLAFVHYDPKPASGKQQDAYQTNVSSVDWHQYTIEWDPGSASSQSDDVVSFYLDGRLIGRTTGPEVPDGPMHYIMQMETYLRGQELPAPAEGHVLIDWVTIDVPS